MFSTGPYLERDMIEQESKLSYSILKLQIMTPQLSRSIFLTTNEPSHL
jgi:hypothetical protein